MVIQISLNSSESVVSTIATPGEEGHTSCCPEERPQSGTDPRDRRQRGCRRACRPAGHQGQDDATAHPTDHGQDMNEFERVVEHAVSVDYDAAHTPEGVYHTWWW